MNALRRKEAFKRPVVLVPVGAALLIGALILISHASGSFASLEPESGNITGSASVGSDSAASGGKYVSFGGSGDNNVTSGLSTSLGFGTMAFSDEFTGTSGTAPNSTKWGEKSFGHFVTSNLYLDGSGHLDIHAVRSSTGTWTGGEVESKFGATPPYLYEARVKVPGLYGMWSAPAWDWSYPYGSTCGYEIDNSEQLAKQPTATNFSMHGCSSSVTNNINTPYTLANDYHIYSAAVYADHASFYLDGVLYNTINASQVPTWSGGTGAHSFLTDLDIGACGAWADCPSASGAGSADMLVDWYHVYTH